MDWARILYRPLVARAARHVLVGRIRSRQSPEKGRFTRADVDGFLHGAWARYKADAAGLPSQPTIGSRMNVRLASFTMSFFDELLASGVDRNYAIEIIADAAWRIYSLWAGIALGAMRWSFASKTALGFAAVRNSGREPVISLRFPFNAPGYLIEPVAAEHGVAFDVIRCPVADYFRTHNATDLCIASWCNLDYALAEMTDENLVRTETLVSGNDRCDFRVRRRLDDGLGGGLFKTSHEEVQRGSSRRQDIAARRAGGRPHG